MNTDLIHSIKDYMDKNKKKKHFMVSACALSLCTVLGVYSILMQPAVSKEKRYLVLESEQEKGAYDEVLTLDVTASAKPEQDETYFLISTKQKGAMLSDEYIFEEGIAAIETSEGEELELHREENETDYWFVLEEGKSIQFSLECVSMPFNDEEELRDPVISGGGGGSETATSSNAAMRDAVEATVTVHETDILKAALKTDKTAEPEEKETGSSETGEDKEIQDGSSEENEAKETGAADTESGKTETEAPNETEAEPTESESAPEESESEPEESESVPEESESEPIESESAPEESESEPTKSESEPTESESAPEESESAPEESGTESEPAAENGAGSGKLPAESDQHEESKAPVEVPDEFAEELSLTFFYIAGDSLEDCEESLKEDGESFVLTWMNEEELIKEGIAAVDVEIEQDEVNAGEEITAWVQASLNEEAEEAKIVSLLFDSEKAGLNDEYTFHRGICELEDSNGEVIALHREKTSSKNVIQYWFSLEPGSEIEFELGLTDTANRKLEADGGYGTATSSDAEKLVDIPVTETDVMELSTDETEYSADEAEKDEPDDTAAEATPSEAYDTAGSELEVSAELLMYAGVGDTRRKSGMAALKKTPSAVEWFKEGTFILTRTLEDGTKVTLTAPGGAFPEAGNLELAVRKLEGEEAAAAEKLINESAPEGSQGYYTLGYWDITILDDGVEVQPQKSVAVTFSNVQNTTPEAKPVIFHIDEENAKVDDMNAAVSEDGEMKIETDHFSTYAAAQAADIGTAAGTSEAIPEPGYVTEGQLAPYNRLQINDVDGSAKILGYGNGVSQTQDLNPLNTGGLDGDLWNGNWSDTVKGPYPDFNRNYGAIAVQFKGSNTRASGYSTGTTAGWSLSDLSLDTTSMWVKVQYDEVGTYDEKPIGAIAEIKVTPMKNRNGTTWERDDYNGIYYPIIQISDSLYSGWDWQNVKEFHVGLTFYFLKADGTFGDAIILNEGVSPDYDDREADYYTINSLNPAYVAYAGEGYNWHSFGPEYVLPDNVNNVKAYRISPVSGGTEYGSHIKNMYSDSKYVSQYAYNGNGERDRYGNGEEWTGDRPEAPNWLQNSVMIIPPKDTKTLGFTLGNLMRIPETATTTQKVPHTDNMWATFSSSALTQQQKVERTSISVNKVWAGEEDKTHDPVDVSLYADGADTGQTLTLNDGNGWTGTFTGLPVYPDDDNTKPKIEYSVLESDVEGYNASYEYASGEETGEKYWIPATEFVADKEYALVVENTNYAVQNASGSTLTRGTVTKGTESVKINDKDYSDYLTEVQDAFSWIADQSGTTAQLRNTGTGNALKLASGNSFITDPVGSNITYDGEGKLSAPYYTGKRYLKTKTGRNDPASTAVSAVTANGQPNAYTLYQKVSTSGQTEVTITNRPVVPVPSDKPQFEHHKTIDYLGDGVDNPHTDLKGDDLYRLYLDMTGKREPTDLLVVVDRSGSMSKTINIYDESSPVRSEAVSDVLNGTKSEDGLLKTFMEMNPDNKYAVISFQGDGDLGYDLTGTANWQSGNGWKKQYGYSYKKDSGILSGNNSADAWKSEVVTVNTSYVYNNGTNYEAGLMRADEVFREVNGDGHRKLMIFLSDGVPTYYITNGGNRWGNGDYKNKDNYFYCKEPSKTAFDDFQSKHSDVLTYTIGVSADINGTSVGGSTSPEVLQDMATQGGGKFYGVTDMTGLKAALLGILYPSHVTITDNLSQYVEWYGDQPDAKVIMTNRTTEEETVLYENGKPTQDGRGIMQQVTYQKADSVSSTGTIQAVFVPGYHMKPEYTYTLSFNVQTTQKAYDDYKTSGYGNTKGDINTDYGSNRTSSDQPGFHSNESANVSYVVADKLYQEKYQHPVIQVQTADFNILKRGEGNAGTPLQGVEFALYKAQISEDGTWSKDGDPIKTGVTEAGGTMGFDSLMGGYYLLFETRAAAGYVLPEDPWRVTVARKNVTVTDSQDNPVESSDGHHILINQKIYELPETGGMGTRPYIAGGALMMLSACLMYINIKKRREVQAS